MGPRRAVASGLIAAGTMRAAMWGLFAAAFLCGLGLVHWGGPWLIAGGLVALAAGVAILVLRPGAVTGDRIATASLAAAFLLAAVAAWRAQAAARRVS